ncbi:hypothetical protein NHH03_24020 [Stieleria sp. TO1_6]|uniref:hypothetical protein n=1 Tax=Stieleria tagensis TaxID=2956795 RepID=UPI00209A8DD3|nr:hypothetical protein [Stieleria tagensis]MCO8124826.1 hypothetical protein [Stieleria tagensis]
MIRRLFIAVALLLVNGCYKPPPAIPPVSTDTTVDLHHDHKHLHSDQHRHEHQHDEPFEGMHAHPHGHAHRHAAGLHGGSIVSLQRVSGDASGMRPHLEVVSQLPQGLLLYFLAEDWDGNFTPWQVESTAIMADIHSGAFAGQLQCIAPQPNGPFVLEFPAELHQAISVDQQSRHITIDSIRWENQVFSVREKLLYRQGELSVIVD